MAFLFCGFIQARKSSLVRTVPICIVANSYEEATGRGLVRALEDFPGESGWTSQTTRVMEVPEKLLRQIKGECNELL